MDEGIIFPSFECSHNDNASPYYNGADETLQHWEGYDTIAQTDDMIAYLRGRAAAAPGAAPFCAFLSWGTPHDPYQTAPEEYRALYPPGCELTLRPNVPEDFVETSSEDLRGCG